jgi:hypothetical protein
MEENAATNEQTNEQTSHRGRQKGTPNKLTAALRVQIGDIIEDNMDQLMVDLACMKPVDRVTAMLKLMTFVMPTLKAVEMEDVTPVENKQKFQFVFVDKSKYSE